MDAQHPQRGQQWLEALLPRAGFAAKVGIESPPIEGAFDGFWLTIQDSDLTPGQVNRLLAKEGAVLDALQYLINATLNMGQNREAQVPYTVELAGFRAKRYRELQSLAQQAAEQVRQTLEEFEMQPLSSAERRMVHTLLHDSEDLETYSRGQEPDRRLVVRLRSASDPPEESAD